MQNQHPRLPVSFLPLHTNRLKAGSHSARVLPGVGGGSPPQGPATWSFQASPTQKTPLGCTGSVYPPRHPPSLVTAVPSRGTRNSRSRRASLLVPRCQLRLPLHSPALFPGQLGLQGWTVAQPQSPRGSTAQQTTVTWVFLSSPYFLGVLLIYRVVSVSECWAAHLHIHTPVLSWILSWDSSGPASTGTVSLLQEVLVDCLFYSQEFM